MRRFMVMSLLLILSTYLFAQYRTSKSTVPGLRSNFIQPTGGSFMGIIDPDRIDMSQSYSLTYASSGNNGFMQGLYLNNIRYRLSAPLMLNLQLGYLHTPYNSYGGGFNQGMNGEFVGGASLIYKPSRNVSLSLGFSRMPYYYSPYGYYPQNWFSIPGYEDPLPYRPKEYTPAIDDR